MEFDGQLGTHYGPRSGQNNLQPQIPCNYGYLNHLLHKARQNFSIERNKEN